MQPRLWRQEYGHRCSLDFRIKDNFSDYDDNKRLLFPINISLSIPCWSLALLRLMSMNNQKEWHLSLNWWPSFLFSIFLSSNPIIYIDSSCLTSASEILATMSKSHRQFSTFKLLICNITSSNFPHVQS